MLVSRSIFTLKHGVEPHLPTLFVHQGMSYEPCPVPSSAPYCCVPRCCREVAMIVPGLHSIVSAKLYSGSLFHIAFALLFHFCSTC